MSRDPQRLQDYLEHILQAITRIQDAVIRNFEIIGEASKNIDHLFPEFASSNPDLPLLIAYEMRNALAHGYFKVDLQIVWKTIELDLPMIQAQVSKLINIQ